MATPYASLRFIVRLSSGVRFGGFAEVTGLHAAVQPPGSDQQVVNVSLKNGRLNPAVLYEWLRVARLADPSARQTITIAVLDAARNPTQSWVVKGAFPIMYDGTTLTPEATADVPMSELVLSAESIEPVT